MAYGDFLIQRDLNFTVNRGDIFIVMGGSGCGKSTLLRHLVGLQRPAKGRVLYQGNVSFWDAEPEEHPLDVVCRCIKEVLRMYASTPSVSVARYRLIRQVPTLREREIAVVARYERLFTRYLLGRFDGAATLSPTWQRGSDDDPMLAEVSAAAVVAAHNHVLRRWLGDQ